MLKSWAVTAAQPLAADKRLAVRTEDHPLDYGEFEGRIPEGEYGAGSVIVWDRGRWSTEGDPHEQLAKGHLVVDLAWPQAQRPLAPRAHEGQRPARQGELAADQGRGRIRRPRQRRDPAGDGAAISQDRPHGRGCRQGQGEDWRKEGKWRLETGSTPCAGGPGKDDRRGKGSDPGPATRAPSARGYSPFGAGRTPQRPLPGAGAIPEHRSRQPPTPSPSPQGGGESRRRIKGAKPGPLPSFVEPQLASPAAAPPVGDSWVHEIKFDGYRLHGAHRPRPGQAPHPQGPRLDRPSSLPEKALEALPVSRPCSTARSWWKPRAARRASPTCRPTLSDGRSDRFRYYAVRSAASRRHGPDAARR